MKLPRWLVIVMLTASAGMTIALPAFWWITWPSRTICEFTSLLEQGRFDEANQRLKPPLRLRVDRADDLAFVHLDDGLPLPNETLRCPPATWQAGCTLENLQTDSRSIQDMLLGRQAFTYHRQFTMPIFIGGYAEHGMIVLRCENWAAH